MMPTVVIASPHARNDLLEQRVRERLPACRVVRVRSREDLSLEALQLLDPLFIFFPHWSWLVPPEIYDRFDCVIFHMTDVPYGRGGSPLQNLIVRGHHDTVISALRCESDVDAGGVYMKRPLSLTGTAEEILVRASTLMEGMMVEMVESRPTPVPQQGVVVRFTRRRPEDSDLAPLTELRQTFDAIRMVDADGYPAAFLSTEHLHLEFRGAELGDGFIDARVRIRKKTP